MVAHEEGDLDLALETHHESLSIWADMGALAGLAPSLEGVAQVSLAHGDTSRAVTLFGAATALREKIGVPLARSLRPAHETDVGAAREQLGDEAFRAARRAGGGLSLEEAVGLALQDPEPR